MPNKLVSHPGQRKPDHRRPGCLDDRVIDVVASLQFRNRHGWCFASARGIRDEIHRRRGIWYSRSAVQRCVQRLTAKGLLTHRRIKPNGRLATGVKTRWGGQHNRYVPRWMLRAGERQAARARRRAEVDRRHADEQSLLRQAAAANRVILSVKAQREQDERNAQYAQRARPRAFAGSVLRLLTEGLVEEAIALADVQSDNPDTS